MQTAAFVLLPESTSPARGTTGTLYPHSNTLNDFNPRPPHGGRHANIPVEVLLNGISIHVPRTGDDKYTQAIEQKSNISIHVPRMGDDHC